jgi:hypothetical protein
MIRSLIEASVDPFEVISTGAAFAFTTWSDEETSAGVDEVGGKPPVPELMPPPLLRLQAAKKLAVSRMINVRQKWRRIELLNESA